MTDSDNILSELSAFLDGELPPDRSAFLLRRIDRDPALRAAWGRWQLASTCLRHGAPPMVASDLAERVAAAVGVEAVPRRSVGTALLRWAGGGAIAAAVAVFALTFLAPPGELGDAPAEQVVEVVQAPAEVAPSLLTENDLRPRFSAPAQTVAANQRLPLFPIAVTERGLDPEAQAYLVRHQTALRQAGLVEFAPYIDVLAHPEERPYGSASQRLRDEEAR